MDTDIVFGGKKISPEEYYLHVLLAGDTIVHGDLEMTDLTTEKSPHLRIQVYKKRHHSLSKKGQPVVREYNKIHYNYMDAVKDFIRLRSV